MKALGQIARFIFGPTHKPSSFSAPPNSSAPVPLDTLFPVVDGRLPTTIPQNQPICVWEIPLGLREPVYMCARRTPYGNEDRFVVMVDAARFFHLWLNDGDGHAVQYPKLHKDYKFHHAEDGFSHGRQNPVPLARVSITLDETGCASGFGFINGVTRTMWLLHNCAAGFPVEVWGEDQAEGLYRAVGTGNPPISIDMLIPEGERVSH